MPPANAVAVERMLDAHEDRVQRLESIAHDTAAKIAVQGERLAELGTKMETGFVEVARKIETCVQPIAKGMDSLAKSVEGHGGRIKDLEESRAERAAAQHEADEKRRARHAKLSAILWAAVGAAVTAILKEGVPALLRVLR